MFFITMIETIKPSPKDDFAFFGDTRCMGYYSDYNIAAEDLHTNNCDIRECLYDYAVVEEIEEGLYALEKFEQWFKWDDDKKGFYEIEKPELTNHLVNWALG